MVTQRTANPSIPVRFRARPPPPFTTVVFIRLLPPNCPTFFNLRKKWDTFVRLLFLAFLPHQQSHSIPGDPFLPRLFGVERGHVRVTPTKDRHELRLRCAVLGCNAGACLAQPVSRTIFEPSSVTPFPHAVAEARCREGLAVGRDQERQVATWPGIDRGLQLWQNWKIERYWTAITVLELGKVKPPILNMLAAKGDHVRLPLAGEQQKRKGKPRAYSLADAPSRIA